MTPSSRVAVVLLNWNGLNMLKEYLPRVMDHTNLDLGRVVVADNGSTDGSLDYVRWMGIDIIAMPENFGYAGGYNRALEQITQEEYTVLLNTDVAPSDGWLEALVEYMDANPDVAACQPKLRSFNYPDMFEYAGAAGGFIDRHGYPFCRGRIFSTVEPDLGQYDDARHVDWASGAALMVRTACFKAVGGLDETFFAHMEEIDLCWRMRLRGWKVAVEPRAVVYHLGGGTLAMGNPRKTYLNFRNNLLLLHKNLPVADRRRTLLVRRLLDTIAWLRAILTLHFRDAAAIFRAHTHYRQMAPNIAPTSPTLNLIASRPNILTAYFLRFRRRFNQLQIESEE
jgi:hypothetical protein